MGARVLGILFYGGVSLKFSSRLRSALRVFARTPSLFQDFYEASPNGTEQVLLLQLLLHLVDFGFRQTRGREFEAPVSQLELGQSERVVQVFEDVGPAVGNVESLEAGTAFIRRCTSLKVLTKMT